MVSFASLFEANPMEEATEQQQPPSEVKMEVTRTPVIAAVTGPLPVDQLPQQQQPDQPMMEVPEQIVVSKKEKSSKKSSSSSSPHKRRSSKDKEKVAKRKSSSKHERKHKRRTTSKNEEGGAALSKEERRKRRRSSKRHRKSSSKSTDPDPNDPATLAKSRELLLAAMGVKKQPETAPCFVSKTSSLDSNPVYQSNKKRFPAGLPSTLSEPRLASAPSAASFTTNGMETIRSMDDISTFHDSCRGGIAAPVQQHPKAGGSDDSEYDQYVEF